VRRAEGVSLKIRVGVNSGDVVVRSVGSDLRMDYTAVGQTTHLAARMEQIADPGSIVIAPETLRLAEGYVAVKPLGPVKVKGVSEPVDVYEVTGAGAVRTRLQRSAARGFTRFVGRDAELELLRGALERAGGEHGQVVTVVGEPGVGKSRLFYEFVHSHRFFRSKGHAPVSGDWLVVESGSVSYGQATPYLPMIDLLKAYFQIDARDDGEMIREKVTGKLLTLDETLRPLLPALLALLDVPVEGREWQALDPPQRRRRTHEAIKRVLLRESQRQPLCLVFEDLHWIDAESQAVLDGLVDSLPAARVLLLTSYRPEYRHTWGSKTYYSQARIDPLPHASAGELLGSLLGTDASVQPLIPLLIERTESNPFFIEESVRALAETGMLVGDPGRYRLIRPLGSIQVPATVQAILAARVDRLPPQEKSLLQSAAVVGKNVSFSQLRAIVELREEALRGELAHLQAAEFLYETSLFPDLEYTFKHALTHEVAYGSILHERRRALHARLVEVIETLNCEHLGEHVDRLAQHALRGEVWPKAVAYLRQAAAKAVARAANRQAVSYLEHALGALRHLPESPETREQAIDLRLDLQSPFNGLGEIERLLDYLREAEPLAAALGDPHRMGRVAAHMAYGLIVTGRYAEAATSGEHALAIARTVGDLRLGALATLRLGLAYRMLGQYPRAMSALKGTVDVLVGDLQSERFGTAGLSAVTSRAYLSWCLADLGEFPAAMAVAEEAVRIAETADDRNGLAFSQSRVGLIYLRQGNPERALPWLERSMEASRRFNFEITSLATAGPLGEARAACGAISEAFALLEQAAERAASIRLVAVLPGILSSLGERYLHAGRLSEARHTAERELQLTRAVGQRYGEGEALRILGEVHARANPAKTGQAEASYREALGIAEQIGTRPLVAHCHLGLGKLYRRTGQREQAYEHFTTATTMYREMDMRFWLEQAEAEMRALG
jgi:tetratricopeptide (TPR) repeat protein